MLKKILSAIVLLLILFIPTLFVIIFSVREDTNYKSDKEYEFSEKGFGNAVEIKKGNFDSYLLLSGTIDAGDRKVLSYQVGGTVLIKEGDEVYEGKPIISFNGYMQYSEIKGIVEKIEQSEAINIVIKPFDNYIINAVKPENWDTENKEFTASDYSGEKYNLIYIYESERIINNKQNIVFSITGDDLLYGDEIELYIKDIILENVFYINKEAIYYDTKAETYKIRLLDKDNNVIDNVDVKIIGEDFNNYAIEYDNESGNYADVSYGKYMNQQNKKLNNENSSAKVEENQQYE